MPIPLAPLSQRVQTPAAPGTGRAEGRGSEAAAPGPPSTASSRRRVCVGCARGTHARAPAGTPCPAQGRGTPRPQKESLSSKPRLCLPSLLPPGLAPQPRRNRFPKSKLPSSEPFKSQPGPGIQCTRGCWTKDAKAARTRKVRWIQGGREVKYCKYSQLAAHRSTHGRRGFGTDRGSQPLRCCPRLPHTSQPV